MTVDWQDIARRHGPLVWRTVYRIVGGAGAADCFQDTFLAALDYARRNTVHNWPGLLQRIATTRALDAIAKRRSDAGRIAASADMERVASAVAPPDARAQEAELAERFRVALAALPPGQREAFSLRYLSEMSYEEIARETGTTPDAVGISIHRARARLRDALLPPTDENKPTTTTATNVKRIPAASATGADAAGESC